VPPPDFYPSGASQGRRRGEVRYEEARWPVSCSTCLSATARPTVQEERFVDRVSTTRRRPSSDEIVLRVLSRVSCWYFELGPYSPNLDASGCSSPRPQSCAGTANSSPAAEPLGPSGPVDRHPRWPAPWSCAWPPRIRRRGTGGSTASSRASGTGSAPRRSGRSSTERHRAITASRRPVAERVPTRRRTQSWPATCSISRPSPCAGSTRSSSSTTPPARCTSWG
jgi:hypothetical protein